MYSRGVRARPCAAAVKRGVWGGRGAVAPLTSMTEAAVGKTVEEVAVDVRDMAAKVFGDHAARDQAEAAPAPPAEAQVPAQAA